MLSLFPYTARHSRGVPHVIAEEFAGFGNRALRDGGHGGGRELTEAFQAFAEKRKPEWKGL